MNNFITTTFKISGITCDACTRLILKRIGKINGVQEVKVDKSSGVTTIMADRKLPREDIENVLLDTEFTLSA